jgi:hypothetical protein
VWIRKQAAALVEIHVPGGADQKTYATDACWSEDGKTVVAVTSDGHIGAWAVDPGKGTSRQIHYAKPVRLEAFSSVTLRYVIPVTLWKSSFYVVIPATEATIILVDAKSLSMTELVIGSALENSSVTAAAVFGSLLYTAHESGMLSVVDLKEGTADRTFESVASGITLTALATIRVSTPENEIVGIRVDASNGHVIVYDVEGSLSFWCPDD